MQKKLLRVFIMVTKYSLLGIFLQCLFLNLIMAYEGSAQKYRSVKEVYVQVEFENSSLLEAFHQIESVTDFKFSYNREDIDQGLQLNMEAKKQTVADILYHISELANLKFKQVNDNITVGILRLSEKASTPSIEIIIEDIEVHGKVTDETGEPLPGVNVIVKNSSTGTITDINGNYKLVISEDATLIFSSIGFISQEIAIKNRTMINVSLEAGITSLDEVVVVGYGTMQKKDITGAISTVNTEDLGSLPVSNIGEAMQGRAAGVQVINSGSPGTDVTFRIRGLGTINNSSPLIVIDGMPMMGGLNQINTDDIESIQVLKDASSAAIYGSRGANGVVLITTKGGERGANNFNVNIYYGMQELASPIDLLNAAEFAQLHNEMMANSNQPLNPKFSNPESLGVGTDWIDELTRTAPIQNYTLSYSGGNEKTRFHASLGYMNQDGIIISRNFKRYTGQLKLESQINDKLKFGSNFILSHTNNKNQYIDWILSDAMQILPTQPVYRDGTYSGPEANSVWSGNKWNPVGIANTIYSKERANRVLGNVFGEYELIKGLIFKSHIGIDGVYAPYRLWENKFKWGGSTLPTSGLYQEANSTFSWLWDNTITFQKVLNNDHFFKIMVGTSAQKFTEELMSGGVRDFASDKTQQLNNGSSDRRINGTKHEWALLSYMGRINYSYKDKYLITSTLRYDGSSRFAAQKRWGLFPSVALAWRISKEDFFGDQGFFNDLKVRLGYGITGNQEVPLYKYFNVYHTMNYNFNNNLVSAVVPKVAANPNLQWEEVEQINLGMDMEFLDSRISLTLDAYIKNTNGMLMQAIIPISMGYSDNQSDRPLINAGKMRNKGIELSGQTLNLTGNLKWNTQFNLSYNHNSVIELYDDIPLIGGNIGWGYTLTRSAEGHPYASFYGHLTDGIFQTQKDVDNHAIQTPGSDPFNRTSPGDIRFKDLNGDGVINDLDRTYLGSPLPKYIFSLGNSFEYKGFDMSVFLQGVSGNSIYNASRIWNEGMSFIANQTTETLGRWTGLGTSNSVPRATYNDPNKNTRVSDRFVEDGSYLRLKTLTIGYTFLGNITRSLNLKDIRVYMTAQNLLTLTEYKGFDPEVGGNGIDKFGYPVARTFSIGVNINF